MLRILTNDQARITEDLLLGQAHIITPTGTTRGLASVLASMNDDADLDNYLSEYGSSKDLLLSRQVDEHNQSHISRDNQVSNHIGTTLAQLIENEHKSVPQIVTLCCQAILLRGNDIEVLFGKTSP